MTAGLRPVSMGPVAAEILRDDGKAEVIAVFERSFYVAAPGGFVCVGLDTLGDGPLNLLVSAGSLRPDWSGLGVTREAEGAVRLHTLSVGEHFSIGVDGAAVWQPPPWPETTLGTIAASLVAVRALATPLCPVEGLSRLVLASAGAHGDRTAAAAAPLVAGLARALVPALQRSAPDAALLRAATLLVGLGPGLTPSGDDLLGGVFLVLSAVRQHALRDAVWLALEPELDLLTVEISGAHLAAAADGLAAAGVHAALCAMLADDDAALPAHLRTLRAIGHSSGFDTLAGIVLALEAVVAAGRNR